MVDEEHAIRRRPADAGVPLSYTQQRLWFVHAMNPGSPALNFVHLSRLRGALDAGALAAAFTTIVERHEVLRTTFEVVDGVLQGRVDPGGAFKIETVDLSLAEDGSRERALHAEIVAQIGVPFDLTRDLPLRVALVRLAADDHALVVVFHHIAADAGSMDVLYRELAECYNAAVEGRPGRLPELPIQFADYAAWQRERVRSGSLEGPLAALRERLAGHQPFLPLPADRTRQPGRSLNGDRRTLVLPPQVADGLGRLRTRERTTLFMILLPALQILLQRHSGEDDIVVGSPVTGRDRPELEGLIGCLTNDLVLRTDLSGNPTFRQLMARARDAVLDAYESQEVPFDVLVDALQLTRDAGQTPLFQVRLNMYMWDYVQGPPLDRLAVEPLPIPRSTAHFDLTLYFRQVPAGVELAADYNADLFDASRIDEILGQLRCLLEQVIDDPDRRIGDLSLVTPVSRAILPDPAEPLDASWHGAVHERFSEQARIHPERIAVQDRGRAWTYRELDTASDRLAGALQAAGIGPEDAVALYAHRSAALVWAVLGVLKAGAAFVVLDPSYPDARLAEIVEACRPRGWLEIDGTRPPGPRLADLLSGLDFRARLGSGFQMKADRGGLPAPLPDGASPVEVDPDSLAVITFTSGSTGQPKGILGRHGSLSHFLPWMGEAFGLGPDDRFSMLSGLAHDPLQRDIFTALWFGATLCVPDPEEMGRPGWLAGWMAREAVSVTNLTPAMLQMLCSGTGGPVAHTLPGLRLAFVIGEALTRRDVMDLRRLAPFVRVVNLYGCTETQRALGYWIAPERLETLGKEVLPVGPGMPGSQVLVMNRSGALAGIGEVGEIHVRSPHLARGYLDDPALTSERFVPGSSPGDAARLYRTGDLGRFAPNGTIEFLGRADGQVKIRGFRVEPGEVEALLRGQPGVKDAVVVPGVVGGQSALVAYVVPADIAPGVLRRVLEDRLPAYMVPSAFVAMTALPMSPSGKIDRRALPPADDVLSAGAAGFVEPRTAVETKLAAIWRELLRVERIGARDNFFDRGGHSLLVVALLGRIRDDFGVDLPPRVPFERPTLETMALAVVSRLPVDGDETDALLEGIQDISEEEAARLLAEEQT